MFSMLASSVVDDHVMVSMLASSVVDDRVMVSMLASKHTKHYATIYHTRS
jgi:hypothetical protein